MRAGTPKELMKWTVISIPLSICVGLLLSLPRGFGVLELAINSGVSLLYSLSIGLPATIIFDRLRPRIHGRPALKQWSMYLGIMLVIVLIASLFAGGLLVLVGLVDPSRMWAVYRNGLLVSLGVSLPVTVGAITMSRMHDSLDRVRDVATEARLASLESRVRPHFLFNALNSAIALIPEDPKRAEDVLERLSALLRFSLDTPARVTLGQELRVVTDYMEIERARFGDRIAFELDVPADLHEREVPAFAVQTLVENSVKHAVSARKQATRIAVRARNADGQLHLEVTDDGPGFSGEIWVSGHGLDGLRSRLDALYGTRAKLVAPAEAERGAAVRIEIQA